MRSSPSHDQMLNLLRRANAVARRALEAGRHPFGALLVAPDHETVLLEQGNLSVVDHAEAVLARTAFAQHPSGFLWDCTLVTTVEPCAMCAATQYWANIGRLVYGLEERQLLALTGASEENPTLDVPARSIYARGQKAMEVFGPFPELEADITALHLGYWRSPGQG